MTWRVTAETLAALREMSSNIHVTGKLLLQLLDEIEANRSITAGIECVHCEGKGVETQHYDPERGGWSDQDKPCETCGGSGRIITVEQYLKTVPANWHEDSSIQTWFPLLNEEMERLRRGAKDHWVPIMVDHNSVLPFIGRMRQVGASIEVELFEPLTREQVFQIFGGAGMMSREHKFDADGRCRRISKLTIHEFSLCPGEIALPDPPEESKQPAEVEPHEHAWDGDPPQCAICGAWRALVEAPGRFVLFDDGSQPRRVHETMEFAPAMLKDEKAFLQMIRATLLEDLRRGKNILVISPGEQEASS